MAIQSSADKKMMLSEIYQWIAERYPYYQLKDKSWRNSIRHNLSLNECFVKCGRSENGKGNYWAIHPANIDDFAKGDFRRRRARRRVRKCDEDLQRLCSDTPEMEMRDIPSSVAQDGYVPMVSTLVPCNFLSIIGIEPVKPCEYWMKDSHNKPVIPYRNPGHTNPFQNNAYTGSDDVTSFCNQSVMPYIPYFGCVNDSDMRTTVEPGDSALNLNLDMPENCAVTSSRPDYVTPCFERERSWKDIHLWYMLQITVTEYCWITDMTYIWTVVLPL